jgi:dihydrofolate synthase/folylpolyglutamate synthase
MEAVIFDELLKWCGGRVADKNIMRERFSSLISLFEEKITFKIIKIAGTNGKGSTASMLSSCFVSEGINVGLFTSPRLISINERFRISGVKVELEEIIEVAKELKPFLDQYISLKGKAFIPSFFEVLILIRANAPNYFV